MDKVLILHWWGWKSNWIWFPWLEKELNSKLFDVYIPNLPHSDNPILEEQLEYISLYSSDFKDWWYLIGHSLWCHLAMNFIQENNIKNSVIILVAPTYNQVNTNSDRELFWESYEYLEKYCNSKIDFEKINKLNNSYYVFLSDNDPFINMENAKKYYSKFKNIRFIDFKNKGHFNTASWTLELPEILEFIK